MNLLKLWLELINRFFFTLVEDLVSFRHKLILVTILLCFMTVKDAATFGIAAGMLTIVLTYYFKLRQDSQKTGNGVKSAFDKEDK